LLEFHEFDSLADPELVSAWNALEESGACPNPFASRVWITLWGEQFAREAGVRAFLGTLSGSPVALAGWGRSILLRSSSTFLRT